MMQPLEITQKDQMWYVYVRKRKTQKDIESITSPMLLYESNQTPKDEIPSNSPFLNSEFVDDNIVDLEIPIALRMRVITCTHHFIERYLSY